MGEAYWTGSKDNLGRPWCRGINCSRCGRFVGRDGYADLYYDGYNGGWEIGYAVCAACLEKEGK